MPPDPIIKWLQTGVKTPSAATVKVKKPAKELSRDKS